MIFDLKIRRCDVTRGCKICRGKPERGRKCMFCGLIIKRKQDMDPKELHKEECFEAHMEYLRETRKGLVSFNMTTTGVPELDAEIVKYLGDWRPQCTMRF